MADRKSSTRHTAMQATDQESNFCDERPTKTGSRLRQVLADFSNCIPNRIIALLMIAGVTSELTLLSQVEYPLLGMGASVAFVTVSFVAWFWLTIGLMLHRASRRLVGLREKLSGYRRVGLTALFLVTLISATMLYVVSWGLFLQTSRFASWEVLRFTFTNGDDLWRYLTEAEPIHLLRGGMIISIVSTALYFLIKPASRLGHVQADRPIFFNMIWILSSLVLLLAVRGVNVDASFRRRLTNLASLANSMNPALTLCSSAVQSLTAEPIRPVLDEAELLPLDTPWSAIPASVSRKQLPPAISSPQRVIDSPSAESRSDQQRQTTQASTSALPSIMMVQIESLRSDVIHQLHQGREITPNINRLAREGLEWINAYSQSTHSDYADPCVVSSLYPLRTRSHHYYNRSDPWPKQLSYDCLKPAGYATATISSQNEMWGRMEWFLDSPNLDLFYHPERAEDKQFATAFAQDPDFCHELKSGNLTVGKFPDRHTAGHAIEWIQQQAKSGKPFLLNMNLQSSHFPYIMPADVPRPFQPCKLAGNIQFMRYDREQVETVRNAYFNSLYETDRQVGRIVDRLRQLGLMDKVILVIVGENGEAFHENHIVCHAAKPYEPAIHVATVMYGPAWFKAATEAYPLEHVDLLPTLFCAIGLQPHPNFQGIDALAEDRPALDKRFLYCHVNSPASTADAVQWAGRWKYLWDHLSQSGELYDLKNDTGEANNLAGEMPELARALHNQLLNWRNRQLAWYHYPAYYRKFFPPKAPAMPEADLAAIRKYLLD